MQILEILEFLREDETCFFLLYNIDDFEVLVKFTFTQFVSIKSNVKLFYGSLLNRNCT